MWFLLQLLGPPSMRSIWQSACQGSTCAHHCDDLTSYCTKGNRETTPFRLLATTPSGQIATPVTALTAFDLLLKESRKLCRPTRAKSHHIFYCCHSITSSRNDPIIIIIAQCAMKQQYEWTLPAQHSCRQSNIHPPHSTESSNSRSHKFACSQ